MVVFRAGALAPPWTALLAQAFPDRSRLQDVKEMLKYAVLRAGATPAHPVEALESRTNLVPTFCLLSVLRICIWLLT